MTQILNTEFTGPKLASLIIGIIGAICIGIYVMPQCVKTIKTKNTVSISLGMFILSTAGSLCFVLMALINAIDSDGKEPQNWLPTLLGNVFSCGASIVVLFFKIRNLMWTTKFKIKEEDIPNKYKEIKAKLAKEKAEKKAAEQAKKAEQEKLAQAKAAEQAKKAEQDKIALAKKLEQAKAAEDAQKAEQEKLAQQNANNGITKDEIKVDPSDTTSIG